MLSLYTFHFGHGFLLLSTDSALYWCLHASVRMCVCKHRLCIAVSSARGAHRHALPVCHPNHLHWLPPPNFPTSAQCVAPLPPLPPIWLEQRVQAGQPSRSLSKAAEYSSSLRYHHPRSVQGRVLLTRSKWSKWGGQTPRGWWEEFYFSYSSSVLLFFTEGCVGSLPLSMYF